MVVKGLLDECEGCEVNFGVIFSAIFSAILLRNWRFFELVFEVILR